MRKQNTFANWVFFLRQVLSENFQLPSWTSTSQLGHYWNWQRQFFVRQNIGHLAAASTPPPQVVIMTKDAIIHFSTTFPLPPPVPPLTENHFEAKRWTIRSYTCFSAILSYHPTLTFSPQSPKETLYLCLYCCLAHRVVVTILKYVYYHMWNRSPVQVRCRKQGTQSWRIRTAQRDGMRGRWEGGSGRGTHVHPWLIHVNVWQKPPQYCTVISLQLK